MMEEEPGEYTTSQERRGTNDCRYTRRFLYPHHSFCLQFIEKGIPDVIYIHRIPLTTYYYSEQLISDEINNYSDEITPTAAGVADETSAPYLLV